MTRSDMYDLTKLTDEELRDLERLLMKALRAPQATDEAPSPLGD
jgi:hypothetical protein